MSSAVPPNSGPLGQSLEKISQLEVQRTELEKRINELFTQNPTPQTETKLGELLATQEGLNTDIAKARSIIDTSPTSAQPLVKAAAPAALKPISYTTLKSVRTRLNYTPEMEDLHQKITHAKVEFQAKFREVYKEFAAEFKEIADEAEKEKLKPDDQKDQAYRIIFPSQTSAKENEVVSKLKERMKDDIALLAEGMDDNIAQLKNLMAQAPGFMSMDKQNILYDEWSFVGKDMLPNGDRIETSTMASLISEKRALERNAVKTPIRSGVSAAAAAPKPASTPSSHIKLSELMGISTITPKIDEVHYKLEQPKAELKAKIKTLFEEYRSEIAEIREKESVESKKPRDQRDMSYQRASGMALNPKELEVVARIESKLADDINKLKEGFKKENSGLSDAETQVLLKYGSSFPFELSSGRINVDSVVVNVLKRIEDSIKSQS